MSVQSQIDRLAGAKTTLGNYLQQNGVAVPSGATLDEMALQLADVIEKQNKITASGILKGDGQGGVTAAVAGTDYLKTAPVTSVNGKTGAVALAKGDIGLSQVDNVRQYSAQNPPPYPVTSVNGKTGAVTVREVPPVTASDNGKSAAVVNGAWAAVDKTPFYVNCTISGYGVYDTNVTHDKTYAEIMAAYQGGRQCYAVVKLSDWGDSARRFILPLVDINTDSDPDNGMAKFAFSQIDTPDGPEIMDVQLITIYSAAAEGIVTDRYLPGNTEILPEVTDTDNGKFLRVVDGAWEAVTISDANGGSF